MKLFQLICSKNIAYRHNYEKCYCYITEIVLNYILTDLLDQISRHCSFNSRRWPAKTCQKSSIKSYLDRWLFRVADFVILLWIQITAEICFEMRLFYATLKQFTVVSFHKIKTFPIWLVVNA